MPENKLRKIVRRRSNPDPSFPEGWNVIPIRQNSKLPEVDWKEFQTTPFPRERLNGHDGNYGVVCGEISGNLLVIDPDFKNGNKRFFEVIMSEYESEYLDLAETYIVSTPHGYHLYYVTEGFSVDRKVNKNVVYQSKTIKQNGEVVLGENGEPLQEKAFAGITKTRFSNYLTGVDFLGNKGYALIPPSVSEEGLRYEPYNENSVKRISHNDFERIKNFFLLDRPQRMRKAFVDILNGKLDIEAQSAETGVEKFQYFGFLFREAYHQCGLEPHELYEFLERNQPCFNREITEQQLQHHPYTDNPLTTDRYNELFPEHRLNARRRNNTRETDNSVKEEYIVAQHILENYLLLTVKSTGKGGSDELVRYKNGRWRRDQETFVQSEITKWYRDNNKEYARNKRNAVMDVIKALKRASVSKFDASDTVINFKNGLYDVRTQTLSPHPTAEECLREGTTPYLSFRQIPTTYNPEQRDDRAIRFVNEVVPEDHRSFMFEWFGLCLTPITKFQKALFLYGEGNNGKTVLITLLKRLVGVKNTSKVGLTELHKNFLFGLVEGKLLNGSSETDTNAFPVRLFKEYVGNEGTMTVNNKYKTPYESSPTAKLMFSFNDTFTEVPDDTDKGFFRKCVLVEMPYDFSDVADENLIDKIATPEALSGLLNEALEGLHRLLERGRFEERYYDWHAVKDLWTMRSNDFATFVEECGEKGQYFDALEDPNNEYWALKEEALRAFNEWRRTKTNKPAVTSLGKLTRMVKKDSDFSTAKRVVNGVRTPVYTGFKLKPRRVVREATSSIKEISEPESPAQSAPQVPIICDDEVEQRLAERLTAEDGVETGDALVKLITEEFDLTEEQATQKFERWTVKNAEAGAFQYDPNFDDGKKLIFKKSN